MKKNWPLILGVGVPALFLLAILGFALLPSLGEQPSHDILLAGSDVYSYGGRGLDYEDSVVKGKIVRKLNEQNLVEWSYSPAGVREEVRRDPKPSSVATLYRYSVATGAMKEISFEDAQALTLDAGPTSDDGFSVGGYEYGYSGGGIFDVFGAGQRNRGARMPIYYGGKVAAEVKVAAGSNDYGSGLRFIAWIQ